MTASASQSAASPAIRVVMMPRDANPQGTIFGGVILSQIDQAAWIEALRTAPLRYVTIAMDKVEFKRPVHVGDILSLWCTTVKIGRTSIRVHVDVRAFRPDTQEQIEVTAAEAVLVALNDAGKPTPIKADA